jgi:hypothetical protein
MSQHIAANDPRLTWSGAISTEVSNEWVMPWRIEHEERELYDSELALRAAGCRRPCDVSERHDGYRRHV